MTGDLRDLYQEVILDHHKHPRNSGRLEDPTGSAEGYNPLCGDMVSVTLRVTDGRIEDIKFMGQGCAISTASASLMTEAVLGKTLEEADAIFESFHAMVTQSTPDLVELGDLAVFAGVKEYPVRIKCAVLPWHALKAALAGEGNPVSTE